MIRIIFFIMNINVILVCRGTPSSLGTAALPFGRQGLETSAGPRSRSIQPALR